MELLFVTIAVMTIPTWVALTDFFIFLKRGRFYVDNIMLALCGIAALVAYPAIYIGLETENNCCSESAAFAKEHVISIIAIILCYCASYFYSFSRTKISSPIIEVCANTFLIIGIVLNIIVAIHTENLIYAALGNLPAILLMTNMLIKNHIFLLREINREILAPANAFEKIAFKILYLPVFAKLPLLMILCLPLLAILVAFLLLFGQKPDSIILAFTQTYKHGFSQLDYECDNVQCGGHYLCSVAANGHKDVVKPQRLGIRHDNYIICNRQLLVSNAFEELLAEKIPAVHKVIRKNYNKVGNVVHKYYDIFNNKLVADVVYLFMKPAEWFFIVTLYAFDKKPENRIAMQYLSPEDRGRIKQAIKK